MDLGSGMTIKEDRNSKERSDLQERLNGPGYMGIETGIFVPEESAFDYALEQCFEVVPNFIHRLKWTQEFRDMLIEWFYSGSWIRED